MSAQMSTMFLSGTRGRAQVISVCFYLLLSCILLWNTDCSISLQKFAKGILEIDSPMYYFKVPTVQIPACQTDQCRTDIAADSINFEL